MAKGGARVGAGRPKGSRNRPRVPLSQRVVGFDGRPYQPFVSGPAPKDALSSPLAEPPADLPEKCAAEWRKWAPHAVSQGTLVPATVQGFRQLAELSVMTEEVSAAIREWREEKNGYVMSGAAWAPQPLIQRYSWLAQRLEAAMARYRLTAQGKPEPSAVAKPKAASPWALVSGAR